MPITDGDLVTIEFIGHLEDGTIFDTSDPALAVEVGLNEEYPDREFEPLTLEIGADSVLEGLQEALEGMEVGDTTTIELAPERAFGQPSPDLIGSYNRDAFENMIGDRELEMGFEVESDDGLTGRVTDIGPEEVTIDFNHEYAGEALTFEIEVVDVE